MHLTSIGKSIVLIVAFATQCVYAKSRNGYGYFDEKFCVLEWIIYLKRLSLIALMLCSIILYYVPKSRSYARRACCILIDTIANGLKYALNTNGTEQEKIKAKNENHKNSDLKIQELYRKVYEKDARDRGQKYTDTTNFNNSNPKSIRQHKSKKFSTKHTVSKEHERYYHRNNNVLPESNAVMTSTINSPQQITVINGKCKENNIIQNDTFPKTRLSTYTISVDKLKNDTASKQENFLNKKTDFSTISEIINKNDINYKLMKFKTSQKQKDMSDINTINIGTQKLHNKQNLDCKMAPNQSCCELQTGFLVVAHQRHRDDTESRSMKSERKKFSNPPIRGSSKRERIISAVVKCYAVDKRRDLCLYLTVIWQSSGFLRNIDYISIFRDAYVRSNFILSEDGTFARLGGTSAVSNLDLRLCASVPEAGTACTWLKSNKGTGEPREPVRREWGETVALRPRAVAVHEAANSNETSRRQTRDHQQIYFLSSPYDPVIAIR